MHYKRMGKNGDRRVHIPTLDGGLNVAVDATMIADNELADVQNLRCKNGVLQTRQALRTIGGAPVSTMNGNVDYALGDTAEYITTHPFEVDGELCVVVIDQVNFKSEDTGSALASRRMCRVITLDGALLHEYLVPGIASGMSANVNNLTQAVAVPCDKVQYGCAFLLYYGGRVYRPNDAAGEMALIGNDEIYAPLVMVDGRSYDLASYEASTFQGAANGTPYEGFNTLTNRYRCRFTGGGVLSLEYYYLPTAIAGGITVEGTTKWGHFKVDVPENSEARFQLHDGNTTRSYVAHLNNDQKRVYIMPPLPASTLENNVEITATVTGSNAPTEKTRGASLAAWFGGTDDRLGGTRIFLGGFDDRPSKLMWSEVNNPLYFPENNVMYVGDMSQKITALEKQKNMLVIFKEREIYFTTGVRSSVDKDAILDGTNSPATAAQAYFSLAQLSPYNGCDCPHTLAMCRDRLVWMCADGRVYMLVSMDQHSECGVLEIGGKICERILRDTTVDERRLAAAADYDGCYCLLIGERMFSFDYAACELSRSTVKRIAWYTHTFDGFQHGAWQRIVSDGARRALVLSTCHLFSKGGVVRCEHAFVRTAYRFTDDPTDAYLAVTSTNGAMTSKSEERPIAASLTTKSFDFGEIAAFKRIKALYLAAKGQARVSFFADGAEESPRFFAAFAMGVHLIMPSVKRCQTIAVRLESGAPLTLRGLRLQYQPIGTVR